MRKRKQIIQDKVTLMTQGILPLQEVSSDPLSNEKKSERKGITIRFEPQVRAWLDQQAEHLDVSTQAIVSMALGSLVPRETLPETRYDRFEQFLSAHDIGAFDIPSLFSDSFKRSELMEGRDSVESLLTDARLHELSGTVGVELRWLQAQSKSAIPYDGHFTIEEAGSSITHFMAQSGTEIEIYFVVDQSDLSLLSKPTHLIDDTTLRFAVALKITNAVGSKVVSHYRLSEVMTTDHFAALDSFRSLMTECADKQLAHIGVVLDNQVFHDVFKGETLAADAFRHIHQLWYPTITMRG